MTSQSTMTLIVSCEHATNYVPEPYRPFLAGCLDDLDTHRGYDPGAEGFARLLADRLAAPLFVGTVSRLLVDLNRSLANRRSPPVARSSDLPAPLRQEVVELYYLPYRRQVEEAIGAALRRGQTVHHLSIHSFTPVLAGRVRTADVGFLYDPRRELEKEVSGKWRAALEARDGRWRLRRNYPYRGSSDGFVTSLRKKFPAHRYLGLELEINQLYPLARGKAWLRLQEDLLTSFLEFWEVAAS